MTNLAPKTVHKQQDKLIGISFQGYHGEGTGNPLQYSCLENPMGRGAWWATVYKVTKSQSGEPW